MKAWTLNQLKLAHELCFHDTFKEAWQRHAPDDEKALAGYMTRDMQRAGGLIPWIFIYSRADFDNGLGTVIDNIIEELLGQPSGTTHSDRQIDSLLGELDDIARNIDPYEYGLPLFSDKPLESMRAAVREMLKESKP